MTDLIGGTSWFAGTQGLGGPTPGGFRQAILGAASQALGMSTQDVQSALGSGQSLADLAKQKGVSTDQLVATVAQAIQSATSGNGGSGVSDASQIAQRIVDRKGGLGGHHHHGGAGAVGSGSGSDADGDADGSSSTATDGTSSTATDSSSSSLTVLANLLGISPEQLLTSLESGTSLTDLLGPNGLTQQALASGLGQGTTIDTTA